MTSPIEVAMGVLVRVQGGEVVVLISRRPDRSVYGGYWEFPGGKVEPGETTRRCLVREFEEELGVTVRVGESLDAIDYQYDHGTVRLNPFLCSLESGRPTNIGVAEHRWVRPSQLSEYRFPPANEGLVRSLPTVLRGRQAAAG